MLPNLITDQLGTRQGIVSLLQYDPSLFDGLTVPDGLDATTAINYILMTHGKTPLMHPDPEYMRFYIHVWNTIQLPIWEKLYQTTQYEYNAIHNYDRTETITETTEDTRSGSLTGSNKGTNSQTEETTETVDNSGSEETEVSAENVSTYQPEQNITRRDSQDNTRDSSIRGNTSQDITQATTDSLKRVYTHSNRTEGNVGITTTQQMLQAERDIVDFSVYQKIAEDFVDQFCLYVW